MRTMNRFFSDIRFEVFLVLAICASIALALLSLFRSSALLEYLNLGFSLFFCMELGLRFAAAEKKAAYWKDFWPDWLASLPWEFMLMAFLPVLALPLAWLRLLRIPRVARILRLLSFGRSGLAQNIRYRLRRQMEKSLGRQLLLLGLVSLAILFSFGLAFKLMGGLPDYDDPFYFSLITLISSDSIFEVEDAPLLVKSLTLLLAFLGIVLFNGLLIALVVSKTGEFYEGLRRGRGAVMEKNHLVLLGWRPSAAYFLRELDAHCRKEGERLTVLVLAAEGDAEASPLETDYRYLDIVLRRGLPYQARCLEELSLARARAIFLLGDDDPRQSESLVIKSLLTIRGLLEDAGRSEWPALLLNLPEGRAEGLLTGLCPPSCLSFDPLFYSAKILGSVLREPALLPIFEELFSFRGSEFYLCSCPALAGRSFESLPGSVEGLQILALERGGKMFLGMPGALVLERSDRLLVLGSSKRRSTALLNKHARQAGRRSASPALPVFQLKPPEPTALKTAIFGINRELPSILEELEKHNSDIYVYADISEAEFRRAHHMLCKRDAPAGLRYHSRASLLSGEESLPEGLERVLILAEEGKPGSDAGMIDADTLCRFLELRPLLEAGRGPAACRILLQILSPDSEEAIRAFPGLSFVIGPRIVGRLLGSCLSEMATEAIFRQIIQGGGIDIGLSPISMDPGKALSVAELARVAAGRGMAFLGLEREGFPILNPASTQTPLVGDRAILLYLSRIASGPG